MEQDIFHSHKGWTTYCQKESRFFNTGWTTRGGKVATFSHLVKNCNVQTKNCQSSLFLTILSTISCGRKLQILGLITVYTLNVSIREKTTVRGICKLSTFHLKGFRFQKFLLIVPLIEDIADWVLLTINTTCFIILT